MVFALKFPKVKSIEIQLNFKKGCILEIKDLLTSAWDQVPEKRPNFSDFCNVLDDTKQHMPLYQVISYFDFPSS